MKNPLKIWTLILLTFLCAPLLAEETVYVSDVLYVPLRSGASIEYRIINAALKSGTKLARLEQSEDGVWSKVRIGNGPDAVEGWIRNQYVANEMTSQLKLTLTETKLARSEKSNAKFKALNKQLKKENSTLTRKGNQVSQSKSQISRELDALKQLSSGAVELDKNYQELLQKHAVTQTQRDSLMAENEQLEGDQSLSFMLYGAGILLLGVFLAIALPALKPKKGYSEWQ